MAEELSQEYCKQIKFPRCAMLHLIIRLRGVIVVLRYLQRLMTPGLTGKVLSISVRHLRQRFFHKKEEVYLPEKYQRENSRELITSSFETERLHYQTEGWAFVDGVLDEAFHRELISQWPKRRLLDPPRNITKGYDIGFHWDRGKSPKPDFLENHSALNEFFEYLCSRSFSKRISEFSLGYRDLSCHSFLTTTTYPGSSVSPHRDSSSKYSESQGSLNIIFFINGTGGPSSGGLSIVKDNAFRNIVFEADKLRNTALVYDIHAPFFHGVKPVAWGKFRWMASALFFPVGYSQLTRTRIASTSEASMMAR